MYFFIFEVTLTICCQLYLECWCNKSFDFSSNFIARIYVSLHTIASIIVVVQVHIVVVDVVVVSVVVVDVVGIASKVTESASLILANIGFAMDKDTILFFERESLNWESEGVIGLLVLLVGSILWTSRKRMWWIGYSCCRCLLLFLHNARHNIDIIDVEELNSRTLRF